MKRLFNDKIEEQMNAVSIAQEEDTFNETPAGDSWSDEEVAG